jgi:hypothetical protein
MAITFGVSREAAIWRLRNLNLINAHKQELFLRKEKEGLGKNVARLLGISDMDISGPSQVALQNADQRLFSLAVEAEDASLISRGKLVELLKLAGLAEIDIFELPQARRIRK